MDENSEHVAQLEAIVDHAGGVWVGVQHSPDEDIPVLVLFKSQETGTTLALADDAFFTVNAVQQKIYESNKRFGILPKEEV